MSRHNRIGMLAGWALWAALFATYYACSTWARDVPKAMQPVLDDVAMITGLASVPVALGGFMWVWGVGPRPPVLPSAPFNILLGLAIYGLLGAWVARLILRSRSNDC